jgi:hypothetical protein
VALGLRQTEDGPYETDETERCPDIASLALRIPGGRVENGRVQEVGADTSDVVAVAGKDCNLDPKTSGRDLRDETIGDGSGSKVEGKYEDKLEGSRRIAQTGSCVAHDTQETHQHRYCAHDTETSDKQLSSINPLHTKPRANCTTPANGIDTETEVEGLGVAETDLLERSKSNLKSGQSYYPAWSRRNKV